MDIVRQSGDEVLQSVLEKLRLGNPAGVLPASSTLVFLQERLKEELADLEYILSLCRGQM